MKFQEQYKSEMNSISPTEEQCQRIYSSVYEKIQDSENTSNSDTSDSFDTLNYPVVVKPSGKKPLKLKAIALSGASAACVAVLAGVVILSRLSEKDNITSNGLIMSDAMNSCEEDFSYTCDSSKDIFSDSYSKDPDKAEDNAIDNIVSENQSNSFGDFEITDDNMVFSDDIYLKLVFYGNCSECILHKSSGSQHFFLTNSPTNGTQNAPDTPYTGQLYELTKSQNNLGQKLSVIVAGDIVSVLGESGETIGIYVSD